MLSVSTPVPVTLGLYVEINNRVSCSSEGPVQAFWQIAPASSVWRRGIILLSPKGLKAREVEDKDVKDEQCGCVFCRWLLFEVVFLVVLLNVFSKAKEGTESGCSNFGL